MIIRGLVTTLALTAGLGVAVSPAQTQPAAPPADGITMDMMPITNDQITQCRQQASQQLAEEQDTLHKREHGQDNDKMKQGAVAGATGVATSAVSRKGGWGWWGGGNNNGAQTAAATGATERTNRNSDNVASTTGIAQDVGSDAYKQCIAGIKGPEYVAFRTTGHIPAPGTVAATNAAAPAVAAAPAAAPAPAAPKSQIQDEGDGKHFVLTQPGKDATEVTQMAANKNLYLDEATGDKYLVGADGSVTRIPHRSAATKSASAQK